MHDLRFARQIVSVIEETLRKEHSDKPVSLVTAHVSLSPFSQVSPQRLKDVFELLLEGENLPLIELDIKTMEIEIFCKRCHRYSKVKEPTAVCPYCKIEDIQVFIKEEFVIDLVEIETDASLFNEERAL